MDVPMDPEIEKVVLEMVARGAYPSVASMVEEALYLLVERDWARSQAELHGRRMPDAFDPNPEDPTGGERP